jgi:hypothetical protein
MTLEYAVDFIDFESDTHQRAVVICNNSGEYSLLVYIRNTEHVLILLECGRRSSARVFVFYA